MSLQQKIVKNNDKQWKRWREVPIWYWALCICGESGELANKLKKIYRGEWGWKGKTTTREELIEELADIQIYLYLLAETWGVSLETETLKKIKIVNERFIGEIDDY